MNENIYRREKRCDIGLLPICYLHGKAIIYHSHERPSSSSAEAELLPRGRIGNSLSRGTWQLVPWQGTKVHAQCTVRRSLTRSLFPRPGAKKPKLRPSNKQHPTTLKHSMVLWACHHSCFLVSTSRISHPRSVECIDQHRQFPLLRATTPGCKNSYSKSHRRSRAL